MLQSLFFGFQVFLHIHPHELHSFVWATGSQVHVRNRDLRVFVSPMVSKSSSAGADRNKVNIIDVEEREWFFHQLLQENHACLMSLHLAVSSVGSETGAGLIEHLCFFPQQGRTKVFVPSPSIGCNWFASAVFRALWAFSWPCLKGISGSERCPCSSSPSPCVSRVWRPSSQLTGIARPCKALRVFNSKVVILQGKIQYHTPCSLRILRPTEMLIS